jgi:hypothetical protein
MDMDKHTPGPWYTTGSSPDGIVYGANHTLIVPHQPTGFTAEEQWANAQLMAAAPELLAALKNLVASVESILPIPWAQVEAAIAKANVLND